MGEIHEQPQRRQEGHRRKNPARQAIENRAQTHSRITPDNLTGQPQRGAQKERHRIGWQRSDSGDTPIPKDTPRLVQEAMTNTSVWESAIEGKRYDEIADDVRVLESGLIEATTYHLEHGNRQDVRELVRLRRLLKARLKLSRAFDVWNDHANDSMDNIREAYQDAGIKLQGSKIFSPLLENNEIRQEFFSLMSTSLARASEARAGRAFTNEQMEQDLQTLGEQHGIDSPQVWARRKAWQLYVVTAAHAELDDPTIQHPDEHRNVKYVMNPRRGVYLNKGLSGTVNPVEFGLLDEQVEVVALRDEAGNVTGHEGRRLDGLLKTYAEYLGEHNFWLYLSEHDGGSFWRKQDPRVLERVLERHRNFRDAQHPFGIIRVDHEGNPITGRNAGVVDVPVSGEDLALVNWNLVTTTNQNTNLLADAYETWLDKCRKSEWTRKKVAEEILPQLGDLETMELIAKLSGEIERQEKPMVQRHAPFERKVAIVNWLKSKVCERFLKEIEQGNARDINLQQRLNQRFYHHGGDAQRLEHLYKREFSKKSLESQPISIKQAATYLRMIWADKSPIDFDGHEAFIDQTTGQPISLRGVLENGARAGGWQEEPGVATSFYQWLDVIRHDPQYENAWSWRADQKNAELARLSEVLRANPNDVRSANIAWFIQNYSESIYQFSTFQRDYFEFMAYNGIGYFETRRDDLYRRFSQAELVYGAALISLRRFTPHEAQPGDRMLEVIAGAIMRDHPGNFKYASLEDRDATNFPIWLEGDDRRRMFESLTMGTHDYCHRRYELKDDLPDHPKTKSQLRIDQVEDNIEDASAIIEVFERKSRVGEGFFKPDRLKEIRKSLGVERWEVQAHRLKRWIFGVRDETIEEVKSGAGEEVKKGLYGLPILGPIIGRAEIIGAHPFVTNAAELATYTIAINTATFVMEKVGLPLDLAVKGLADLGFNIGSMHFTFLALSLQGVLGAVINRHIFWRIGHWIQRQSWLEKSIFGKLLSVRETINVNRGDDIKTILKTRGI